MSNNLNYKLYRVIDELTEDGVVVRAAEFRPIKKTHKGQWVVSSYYAHDWFTTDELIKRKIAKWVSDSGLRRLCYPDMQSAFRSFEARKRSQMHKLELQMEQARRVYNNLETLGEATTEQLTAGINLGKTPSFESIVWDY